MSSFTPPGWDEGEALEFSKALKQPMVLQTPLQVILEALFSRIQTQANLFTDVLKRIDHVEAKEVPQQELMHRIKRCEEGLSSINHEKLSPFYQQEILSRIEALESQASAYAPLPDKGKVEPLASSRATTPAIGGGADSILHPPSNQQGSGLDTHRISPLPGVVTNASRLDALEQKLEGVYNLGGKLIALEQIAAEMDIDIPDMECTLSPEDQEQLRQRALPTQAEASQSTQLAIPQISNSQEGKRSQLISPTGRSQDGSRPNTMDPDKQHQRSLRDGGTNTSRPSTVGHGPHAAAHLGTAQQQGQQQQGQQGEGASASDTGTSLGHQDSLQRKSAELNLNRSATNTPRNVRQQTEQQLTELRARVNALQADNQELHRMLDELSHAHDQLEETVGKNATSGVDQLQTIEAKISDLQEAINNDLMAVAKEVRKPPEVSYADLQSLTARVNHAAAELGSVGQSMQQIKTKDLVLLHEQMADVMDQVKKAGQTRDMDTLFHNRLTQLEESLGDVKTEVQLAVADVLEDVVKVSDIQALEARIEERASQEDLRKIAKQQASLAQSISQVATWMASQSSTDEGPKGPTAAGMKMRCFTCDQEVTGAVVGGGIRTSLESTQRPKTNFLPKLDHPHTPNHMLPLGPGINAAEMRKLAEERATAGGRKGSPLRGAEVEDYGANRPSGSPGPGKNGRTPLPSHGLNSIVTRTPNRSPIFI